MVHSSHPTVPGGPDCWEGKDFILGVDRGGFWSPVDQDQAGQWVLAHLARCAGVWGAQACWWGTVLLRGQLGLRATVHPPGWEGAPCSVTFLACRREQRGDEESPGGLAGCLICPGAGLGL